MGLPVVIIGAGTAAVAAAATLRDEGYDGDIVMFGDEGCVPYDRASLSGTFTSGFAGAAVALRDATFYADARIDIHLDDPVVELDVATHRVVTRGGARVRYAKALIATGTSPRRLAVPGVDLPSVHHVHSAWDARLLAQSLVTTPRLVVIGAGFLGCEIAATARSAGCDVTIVSPHLPMEHVLGKTIGEIVAAKHRDAGVTIEAAETVAINGKNDVRSVSLSNGRRIPCRVVVVAIGDTPNCSAISAALCDDGVTVNEYARTVVDDVYAAGSVANAWRPRAGRYLRDGHAAFAREHGRHAGLSMLGRAPAYDPAQSFVSTQYGESIRFTGEPIDGAEIVIRHGGDGRSIEARYRRAGAPIGICTIDPAA